MYTYRCHSAVTCQQSKAPADSSRKTRGVRLGRRLWENEVGGFHESHAA